MPRHSGLSTLTPAGQDVIVGGYSIPVNNCQVEQLIKENERLRGEVESYSEKAARLQKVREGSLFLLRNLPKLLYSWYDPHILPLMQKRQPWPLIFDLRKDLQSIWKQEIIVCWCLLAA